jgi:peptidyl-prolyl cis-trans isomerase SurA
MWQWSIRQGGLAKAALIAAALLAGASIARAQEVVALVDGIPITEYDVAQRTKLDQLSTQKAPARQQVIDELINEILEVREAKRFGIDVPDADVERSYANIASHMGIDSQKLTQILANAGSSEQSLKSRLRAQIAWNALVRGRFKASLEVPDSDVEAELQLHKSEQPGDVGYEYTMWPIVFVVPPGSPDSAYEARKREAEALRARFQSCAEGLPFARALNEVAVRDEIIKFSADLPQQSRNILDTTEVGHLTPPERTSEGLEMFAVCGKKQTKSDTPEEKKIRDEIFEQKFGAQAAAYLRKLRREALIQYR